MIRKADANDIQRITEIYKNVIHSDTNMTRWSEDVYPTADTARKALARGDLFVYEDDAAGRVLATAIINQIQGDAYSKCSWRFSAADNEVMVLHTLAVDPEASHKGIGKQILKFYEEYALDVLSIDGIVGVTNITPVPGSPKYMRGLMNLRGNILHIVDIRIRFGLARRDDHSIEDDVIIVIATTNRKFGILADMVSDVITVYESQMTETPIDNMRGLQISNVIRLENKIIMVLPIEEIIKSGNEETKNL